MLEEIDYAVSPGVLSMPAFALNGELMFSSLPTPLQFRNLLTRSEYKIMDAEALRQAVTHVEFSALWVALVTGIVFSFNPVALAAIPVSMAYVTTSRSHVALGLAISLGGSWVQELFGRAWAATDRAGPDLVGLACRDDLKMSRDFNSLKLSI